MKIPKNDETKILESYSFIDLQDKADPQIKEMVEDWASDFPQWYNKVAYLKFGYDIIPQEEIDDNIKEIINKEIITTEKNLITFAKRLNELKALIIL
jgi:hypothetical protein